MASTLVRLAYILPIVLLFSCEPINDERVQFTINKGMHLSSPLIIKSGKFKAFECEVQFTESCKYQINTSDQGDQNKLFGFGFDNKIPNNNPAHDNSIRWTWTYFGGEDIVLMPYWYENGVRKFGFDYKRKVKIGEKVNLGIYVNDTYVLTFNDDKISIPYDEIKSNVWVLTPYFGGNNTAPQNIKIIFHKFDIK